MKRTYCIVPRIAHHHVARMPHIVAIATRDGGSTHDLGAARGLMMASTVCLMFWVGIAYLT